MVRPAVWAVVMAMCAGVVTAGAQEAPAPATLAVRSNLVQLPALVTTKAGEIVYGLQAGDFVVTDNGVPQTARLEEDTDAEPLALAIVVETGGAGAGHLRDYAGLDAVLEGFVGGVEHRVAVVSFDSAPHVLLPFTGELEAAAGRLQALEPGDQQAALLDGVVAAVAELRKQPARFRRAILLLGETVDNGSVVSIDEALRAISDANTVVYSLAFSSGRAAVRHEASKLNNATPGPEHGCFSKDGAEAEYEGHYGKQVLDCISQLAPPLRLGTMAILAARDGLRTNAPEAMASLTGGASMRFKDRKGIQQGLIAMTKQVPNRYVLSFQPTMPTEGLHALRVEMKDRPELQVRYRTEYWVTAQASL